MVLAEIIGIHRQTVRAEIQNRLDSYTWSNNSAVTIMVPELEQWIWYSESALISYFGISAVELDYWIETRSRTMGMTPAAFKAEQPKELFEYVIRERLRRTISPRDFAEIGKRAGIRGLMECESFRSIVEVLRNWFPL